MKCKEKSIVESLGFDDETKQMVITFKKTKCPECGLFHNVGSIRYQLEPDQYNQMTTDFVKRIIYHNDAKWQRSIDKYKRWVDICPHCAHDEFRWHKVSKGFVVCLNCKKLSVKRN